MNKNIEVQCILHTLCNLNCKFCFETKEKGIREYTKINIDYIRNLPNEIFHNVLTKNKSLGSVEISVMGGELFSDNIPDSIFDVYKEFLYDISNKIEMISPAIKYKFNFTTNAIFTNHNRVLELLDPFNVNLVLSYDPIDRFNNNKQKEIWLDTFNYFREIKKINTSLSIVMTKRCIYEYIKGDKIFNSIDNNIFIDSNIYVPRLDYHDYLPNDDDLYNFYKWCIDNDKYNITHIYNIMLSYVYKLNTSTCGKMSNYIFAENFDNQYGSCYINKCTEESPIPKDDYYGKYSNQIEDVNNCAKYKQPIGLQKRGCLYCEYYSYCPKMCWTYMLFQYYNTTVCPYKRTFDYINENNTIINRFKEWSKEHDK